MSLNDSCYHRDIDIDIFSCLQLTTAINFQIVKLLQNICFFVLLKKKFRMRRRAGVGAIQKQKLEQEKYREKGSEIQENQFQQMSKQLDVFRENLEEFATKHKSEIKKNAQFRRQFQEMCAAIGVDPLASGKGFWSVLGM